MMNASGNYTTYLLDVHAYQREELNLYYAVSEILVAIFAVVGNALVIIVFRKERRLRRRTNYYIVSLAAADLLVGLLGIPFAIMSSVGLPSNLHACLFTVSLLVVLCTISIFCLVAVSVDRYWAILHPMGYSRNVRTKTALVIISICWFAGSIIGFLPLMGWHKSEFTGNCFFLAVMDYNYLVFLYFGTIILPALVLAAFYAHIYQVVIKQLRQIVTMNPENNSTSRGCSSGGTMLRVLGAAQKREVKATQNLAIIVLFFMVCWIPLYTINCVIAFSKEKVNIHPTFMLFCIILSHMNSAGNPLLYAYHLRDFRAALKNFLCHMFGYTEHVDHQPQVNRNSLASANYHSTRQKLQSMRLSRNTYKFHNDRHNCNLNTDSQFRYHKSTTENNIPKITSIVRNSTALAVMPTGGDDINKEIWKIPECSSESSDSFKESSHDKTSMVRPATPYRIRIHSDTINPAYLDNSSVDDESDDVFIEEDSFYGVTQETACEKLDGMSYVDILKTKCMSTSSPQLSRSLFLGNELKDSPKFVRSCSLVEQKNTTDNYSHESKYNTLKRLALSPIRMFRRNAKSERSLSDDEPGSTDSITKKNTISIIKNVHN